MDIEAYIAKKQQLLHNKRLLVAVSGGADSSVLLHVLWSKGYNLIVAHCNFHLRGAESDGDAEFVRTLCEGYGVKCFEKDFDTELYARQHKVSIEMAARTLRYDWFEELRKEQNCDYIVIAHHSDDNVETFFLNLIRGSGLQGLSGMRSERETVIRPLLGVNRKCILEYAESHGLHYRTDSSNREQTYLRNRLRLDIIPRMKMINPSLDDTILETEERMRDANELVHWASLQIKDKVCSENSGWQVIDIVLLQQYAGVATLLYLWLSDYGFNEQMIATLLDCNVEESGQRFDTADYQGVYSRGKFYIRPLKMADSAEKVLIGEQVGVYGNKPLIQLEFVDHVTPESIDRNPKLATLDRSQLVFPLTIRSWQTGDKFYPFGMKGGKKLSDFITDMKLTPAQKADVRVVESAGKIVWVVGYRIDRRFAIYESDKAGCILTQLS